MGTSMADGRMLKKAISDSRRLAELESDTNRLLYTWMIPHLDVEGRITADPDLFKGKVAPRLKNVTPEKVVSALDDMARVGLILLYEVDGDKYLELYNFHKHNKVREDREGKSLIPPPTDLPDNSGRTQGQVKLSKDKLREDKNGPAPCPHQKIIDLYHNILPELPSVRGWENKREDMLRARWQENPERQKLEWWDKFFKHVKESKFLLGKVKPRDGSKKPFKADLEWLIRPNNFPKVLEGKYHWEPDEPQTPPAQSNGPRYMTAEDILSD